MTPYNFLSHPYCHFTLLLPSSIFISLPAHQIKLSPILPISFLEHLYPVNPLAIVQLLIMLPALVRAIIAVKKPHDQKQLVEERVYLAYNFISLLITIEIQDRNSNRTGTCRYELMQRPWKRSAYRLDTHDLCTAWFLLTPMTTIPGMGPPTKVPSVST